MFTEIDDTRIILREGFIGLNVKISPIKDINDLLIVRNVSDDLMDLVNESTKVVDVILEVSYN